MKRVVTRLWDTLSNNERNIIASDVAGTTELSKWFSASVATETKALYESPTNKMNEAASFQYSNFVLPAGWEA